MKITEINVSGFGCIVNKHYDINDFTEIIADNGNGKTTFANFLVCMFHGMNKSSDAKRKYKPWNGETFGGSVTFTVEDKKYKLQRTFGNKKADDTFILYDAVTGKQSQDYSEQIGQELFLVDRDCFERICFSDEKVLNGADDNLLNALNSILLDKKEQQTYLKIYNAVTNDIKTYENGHGKGSILDVKTKLEQTQNEINRNETLLLQNQKAPIELDDYKKQKQENLEQAKAIDEQIETAIKNDTTPSTLIYDERENQLKNSLQQHLRVLNGKTVNQATIDEYAKKYNDLEESKKRENELKANKQTLELTFSFDKPLPDKQSVEDKKQQSLKIGELKKKKNVLLYCCLALATLTLVFACLTAITRNMLFIAVFAPLLIGTAITTVVLIKQIKKTEETKKSVDNFLRQYECDFYDNYQSSFEKLDLLIKERRLKEENYDKLCLTLNKLEQENLYCINNINDFLNGFNIAETYVPTKLSVLSSAVKNVALINEQIKNNQAEKQLKCNTQSRKRLDDLKDKRAMLRTQQQEIDDNILNCQKQVNYYFTLLDKKRELELTISYLTEQYKTLQKEKEVLVGVKQNLEKAHANVTQGVLQPVKNSLLAYGKTLFPTANSVQIDDGLNLSCTFNGITREFDSFSLGQKSILCFALRLGLVNAIFKNQKPFIINDDGLAMLDDNNFNLCKQTLLDISKEYQIFYFAPTNNRKIQ